MVIISGKQEMQETRSVEHNVTFTATNMRFYISCMFVNQNTVAHIYEMSYAFVEINNTNGGR